MGERRVWSRSNRQLRFRFLLLICASLAFITCYNLRQMSHSRIKLANYFVHSKTDNDKVTEWLAWERFLSHFNYYQQPPNKTYDGPYISGSNGSACLIPDMDPHHDSIFPFLRPARAIVCSTHASLTDTTTVEGGRHVLAVDETALRHYKTTSRRVRCWYAVITRETEDANRISGFLQFEKAVILDDDVEFIYVKCHDLDRTELYVNMHAVVQVKPPLDETLTPHATEDEVTGDGLQVKPPLDETLTPHATDDEVTGDGLQVKPPLDETLTPHATDDEWTGDGLQVKPPLDETLTPHATDDEVMGDGLQVKPPLDETLTQHATEDEGTGDGLQVKPPLDETPTQHATDDEVMASIGQITPPLPDLMETTSPSPHAADNQPRDNEPQDNQLQDNQPQDNHPQDKTAATERKPNVLILGIDSMSRLNLKRTMPHTVSHLQANNWIELRQYNKVGDNTCPNLMALLTGLNEYQLKNINCWHDSDQLDNCPFIWKLFKDRGFVTAYVEDEPDLGTFNYGNVSGFLDPPTDYYLRPFMLEAHLRLQKVVKDGLTVCLGPTRVTDVILKYTTDLLTTFQESLFALVWMNNFSHADLNTPAAMDDRVLQFLEETTESRNSSVVIFLSDHGARYGEIRTTYVGWLEERLPFAFIWIPDWFKETYPEAFQNLVDNQDRLLSPFDLHLMLKDIVDGTMGMDGNGIDGCRTCVSPFSPVSEDRVCKDAGITPHWCACADMVEKSTLDEIVRNASLSAVEVMRGRVSGEAKCAVLQLNYIMSARLKERDVNEGYDEYVVVFETVPGLGVFDATVRYWWNVTSSVTSSFKVVDMISRINSYEGQSGCVKDKELKLYCYCLEQ